MQYKEFKEKYENNRVAFVEECFSWRGRGLFPYQRDILSAFDTNSKVAVRGPRGVGKMATVAWLILHYYLTHKPDEPGDLKIAVYSPVPERFEKYLWPEVCKWAGRLNVEAFGLNNVVDGMGEVSSLGRIIECVPPSDLLRIEGMFAESMAVFIVDAAHISRELLGVIEGGSPEVLGLFSTPKTKEGPFYDIHTRAPGREDWHTIHVTKAKAIASGQISPQFEAECAKLWGTDSHLYQNTFEGEFADEPQETSTQDFAKTTMIKPTTICPHLFPVDFIPVLPEDGQVTFQPFVGYVPEIPLEGEEIWVSQDETDIEASQTFVVGRVVTRAVPRARDGVVAAVHLKPRPETTSDAPTPPQSVDGLIYGLQSAQGVWMHDSSSTAIVHGPRSVMLALAENRRKLYYGEEWEVTPLPGQG